MSCPPFAKAPSLADVAAVAGVSSMTVSRVLRRVRCVRAETARRVREAASQLGYRPDPALSALVARRMNPERSAGEILAFVDCDGSDYSRVILEGARREAGWLGYGIERHSAGRTSSANRRLGRLIYHRGIRGVIIGPSDIPLDFSRWDWGEFAAVSIGALVHRPASHSVAMDYFQAAMDGARFLADEGCRRIALAVERRLEGRTGHLWSGGYGAWSQASGQPYLELDPSAPECALRRQVRARGIDGVLTIHPSISSALDGLARTFFLNDVSCPPGLPRAALEPSVIGVESARALHPLLLRRDYGVPALPKMISLRTRPSKE